METWETIGEALSEQYRNAKEGMRKGAALPEVQKAIAEGNSVAYTSGGKVIVRESGFDKAIMAYFVDDHTKICDYLCTHPLSRRQQVDLAWALDERHGPSVGGPRA